MNGPRLDSRLDYLLIYCHFFSVIWENGLSNQKKLNSHLNAINGYAKQRAKNEVRDGENLVKNTEIIK